jgi:UDP-glucose 4-epimerase
LEGGEMPSSTTSLVTGGAGFIGSHVAAECLRLGHTVVVLDDLSGGFEDQVPDGAAFVRGSVTDHELVDRLFNEHQFNFVYHLAAYAAEGLSHFIRRFNYTNNLIGTANLINASVRTGVDCFVFTSSIAVYGPGQVPMMESMVPEPEDPYGVAKYAVEMDLKAAERMFGLDSIVFRPHNVYGVNQNIGDPYRNVIGIFMNQVMQGQPMTVFGDGEQTRAFSHIDDVAPYIARSVGVPDARNETFNLGAEKPYTVNQLAEVVAEAFGIPAEITHLAAREEVVHAFSDHSKIRSVFEMTDPVPLEQGVREMAAWAKAMGPRAGETFTEVELKENMPKVWLDRLDR